MDIRTALASLVAIQESLHIDDPAPGFDIVKAWRYVPPQNAALETPCWLNRWEMIDIQRVSSMRIQRYTIEMQLFVDDADQDVAADAATAFHGALIDALDGSIMFGGAIKLLGSMRGGIVLLERGGLSHIGLDLFLDIMFEEGRIFAP